LKPSISNTEGYLLPTFGSRRLDSFTAADEDRLKRSMKKLSSATYNNAASLMNTVLKAANRWDVIAHVPAQFHLLKRDKARPKFYDFDQFAWLVEAAERLDRRTQLLVLLGGEAGLRRGEIIALEWPACDLRRGLVTVERSEWNGHMTATKGMEYRVIPMTTRLKEALKAHRHLIGDRVLYTDSNETVTAKVLRRWMESAQRLATLRATGGVHILRHTFCSHLAMRGAAPRTIQELAGHKHIATTMQYMHLAKSEKTRAIRLLEPGYDNMTTIEGGPEAKALE